MACGLVGRRPAFVCQLAFNQMPDLGQGVLWVSMAWKRDLDLWSVRPLVTSVSKAIYDLIRPLYSIFRVCSCVIVFVQYRHCCDFLWCLWPGCSPSIWKPFPWEHMIGFIYVMVSRNVLGRQSRAVSVLDGAFCKDHTVCTATRT